jgi:hypothetical protein
MAGMLLASSNHRATTLEERVDYGLRTTGSSGGAAPSAPTGFSYITESTRRRGWLRVVGEHHVVELLGRHVPLQHCLTRMCFHPRIAVGGEAGGGGVLPSTYALPLAAKRGGRRRRGGGGDTRSRPCTVALGPAQYQYGEDLLLPLLINTVYRLYIEYRYRYALSPQYVRTISTRMCRVSGAFYNSTQLFQGT